MMLNQEIINNKYKIEKPLGIGAQGAVFIAQDIVNNRKVALKSQKFMDSREKEIYRILSKNQFLNVINTYDQFTLKGGYPFSEFLIMELGNKDNIYEIYLKQKTEPITPNIIHEIFFQISFGLWELKQLNLIHRDIKPENIVANQINNQIVYQICDLGLSKQGQLLQTMNIGTPYYMAPELIGYSQQGYDETIDIWALAATIYELYTRVPLFVGRSINDVQVQIRYMPEAQIHQKVKAGVTNPIHVNILTKILTRQVKNRPKVEEILRELDSNLFEQQKLKHCQQFNDQLVRQTIKKSEIFFKSQIKQQQPEPIEEQTEIDINETQNDVQESNESKDVEDNNFSNIFASLSSIQQNTQIRGVQNSVLNSVQRISQTNNSIGIDASNDKQYKNIDNKSVIKLTQSTQFDNKQNQYNNHQLNQQFPTQLDNKLDQYNNNELTQQFPTQLDNKQNQYNNNELNQQFPTQLDNKQDQNKKSVIKFPQQFPTQLDNKQNQYNNNILGNILNQSFDKIDEIYKLKDASQITNFIYEQEFKELKFRSQ